MARLNHNTLSIKLLFLLIIFSAFSTHSFGQENKVYLRQLTASLIHIDPLNNSFYCTANFEIINPSNINYLDIKIGNTKGQDNVSAMRVNYASENGKEYLKSNNELFLLDQGRVAVHHLISKEKLQGNTFYVVISGKDKTGADIFNAESELVK